MIPPVRRLGLSTRLLYGAGSIAFGVKDSGFSYFLLIFYNQVLGLPSATVGIAIMIALFVDAFLDPVIGQVSDNWRSRWGRRHPFMYAAALPVALSYLLLWNPPDWGHQGLFFYLIGVAILIRSCISLYEIPSAALVAELTADYDERTRLLSYRYLFGWLGGVGVAFLALKLFLKPELHGAVGQLNRDGYAHYGLAAAGVMLVAILTSAIGTHRHIPNLRFAPVRRMRLPVLVREMMGTLNNRSFLRVLAAALFTAMATGLVLSSALYINTFFWGLDSGQIAVFTIASVGSAAVAFGLAPALSKRFGKQPSAITVMLAALVINSTPIALRLLGAYPSNDSPWLFLLVIAAHVAATSCAITANILISSMTADVVEDSELRTGRRSEGLFFSATAFVNKAVSGVGIFASGLLLWVVGFPDGARPGQIDPQVVRDLGAVYAPTLVGFYVCAALALVGYRITRESHNTALCDLAAEPPQDVAKG